MIIDAHTHIFPDHQAEAALQATARMFNVPTYGTATAADLLNRMDSCGIDYAVIHMVAPTPGLVQSTNTWLIQLRQERFIKFGTLHPRFDKNEDEIKRLRDAGIFGVKLQPDVQQFSPDDPALLYPLYEALCLHSMAVMFHVGGEPLPSPDNRSRPAMIARIARDFQELKIIAAHLGGLNMWEEVEEVLAGMPNVWMETSLSYKFINPALGRRIIDKHGHDRIFFGTDYPFAPVDASLAAARSVSFLSDTQKQDILGNNAYRFFIHACSMR